MRGLHAKDLMAIMNFIYHGEASIEQDSLDVFLALAEELQIKGLSGNQENKLDPDEKPKSNQRQTTPKTEHVHEKKHSYQTTVSNYIETNTSRKVENDVLVPVDSGKICVPADTSMEDLRVRLDSMMERIDDGEYKLKCTVCGKTTKGTKSGLDMRRHIETHMEGLLYPCIQCDRVSKSSDSFRHHVTKYHRK